MTFRFSTPWAAAFFVVTLLVSCNGLGTKDHVPLVYALNLSSQTVSLSLVSGEKALVTFASVAPRESRPLTKVESVEGAVLLVGAEGGPPSTEWTDPSGTPYSLRFQPGHLYAIVVDLQGKAALYSVPETYTDEPKVCFVNVTPATLSQVQAAPDWAKNVKVYAQDLVPVVPTEFYSLEPKTLGFYWQNLEQTASGAHTVATGDDGAPLRPTLEMEHYYLFLAGDGSIRDVTPTLD